MLSKGASMKVARRLQTGLIRMRWGNLSNLTMKNLRELLRQYRFSVTLGDLLHLNDSWYVTHAGLLRLAVRRHCAGISVEAVKDFCDPANNRWIFQAIVYA